MALQHNNFPPVSTGDCFPSAAFEQFFFLLLNALLRKIKRSGNLFFETSEKKSFPLFLLSFFREEGASVNSPRCFCSAMYTPFFAPINNCLKSSPHPEKEKYFLTQLSFPPPLKRRKPKDGMENYFEVWRAKEGNLFFPTFFQPTEIVKRLVVGEMDIFSVFFSHLHGIEAAPPAK